VTKLSVTKWSAVPFGDCNEILHSCSVHAQKGLSPSEQVASDQVTKWSSDQVTKRPLKKMMNNIEATIINGKFSKLLSD
jgi:hypothetical protein